MNDKINDIISLKELRNELIQIVSPYSSASSFFNSYGAWKAFVQILLKSLIDKPIIRTQPPTGNRKAGQFMLEVPDFKNVDKNYLAENLIPANGVFWKIRILPTSYFLTGPLMFTESAANFVNV